MDYQNKLKFKKRKKREKHIRKMANMTRNKKMTKERKAKHKDRMIAQKQGHAVITGYIKKLWNFLTLKGSKK